jgi:2-polyprenyl-6-methoxyphenol hydroxylase-like FAD-dependent oxidoreductase
VPILRPDIAIIGGGLAGSSLAITLRRAGLDVHLIERSAVFRDRIRGELIHPWGVAFLRRLDLLALAEQHGAAVRHEYWQTIRDREVQTPSRWADHFPTAPFGLGFNHVELQDALITEAERLGTTTWRPAEVSFGWLPNREPRLEVAAGTQVVELRPRLVVGADGERSATRSWLGGTQHDDPVHHALGGVLVEGLGLRSDRVHQAFFDGGFAFVSPQAHDRARVYLVVSTERAAELQRTAETGPLIVQELIDATPAGYTQPGWRIIGPAGFFPNATVTFDIPHSAGIVLIGDASGRNDPSQGHGVSLALHDVAVLNDLLMALPWQEVPDAFHARKADVFETLRQHAHWNERQATETGPEIDALRERIQQSRVLDPSAAGFAGIFATGPMGLQATEEARRVYLGENLPQAVP